MHAVSLTPQSQKIFRTTSKSENHMPNSEGVQKKLKMHAVSLTPHARSTHDSMALAAFKGNIYQKHICSRIVLPHR
jgi:cytoplasmic iron level regulating protein YaaA (DUF328/UPF0246 family)